jgi:hypothetical protein
VEHDYECSEVPSAPDRLGVIAIRWRLEVRGYACCRNPVAVALLPRGGTELGSQDGGEIFVSQGSRVGDPPSVLGLEVVGEADEVVASVVIGARYSLGPDLTVGPVGVAVEVAAEEGAHFPTLE